MLPVSDFNFMIAGIATFAATVGYTYARGKLNATTEVGSSNNSETKDAGIVLPQENNPTNEKRITETRSSSDVPDSPARQGTLKRKEPHDGFEDETTQCLGYPHNLANIYPRKRCRTPSSEEEKVARQSSPVILEDSPTDWVFVHNPNSPKTGNPDNEPPRTPSPVAETPEPTPSTASTESPLLVTAPVPSTRDNTKEENAPMVQAEELGNAVIPVVSSTEEQSKPIVTSSEAEHKAGKPLALGTNDKSSSFGKTSSLAPVASLQNILLQKPITSSFATRGFADFAGNKSSFSTFTTSRTTLQKAGPSAWLAGFDGSSKTSGHPGGSNDVEGEHALVQTKSTVNPTSTDPVTTGEEDEEVVMELKSVKLYVKRGDTAFTEGTVGRCKFLKNRATLEKRLLFRRQPLWKISINVRITPALVCSFNATEHVLRIVTQEPKFSGLAASDDWNSSEMVVYAMRPGRSCSKQEFESFSEALIQSVRLSPSPSA